MDEMPGHKETRGVPGWAVVAAILLFITLLVGGCVVGLPWYFFASFDMREEFVDLTGRPAQRALENICPPSIDPAAIESVSYKRQWSRDSFSDWYRINTTRETASALMDHIHLERGGRSSQRQDLNQYIERVRRTIKGPPPLHAQTGSTPPWWTPPAIEFRATENMAWYTKMDSGVGGATYSGFDESTGTLWIYQYAAQHDQLWPRGNVPDGDRFGD